MPAAAAARFRLRSNALCFVAWDLLPRVAVRVAGARRGRGCENGRRLRWRTLPASPSLSVPLSPPGKSVNAASATRAVTGTPERATSSLVPRRSAPAASARVNLSKALAAASWYADSALSAGFCSAGAAGTTAAAP
ncbi:hypothetical protein I4F81_009869 [Pyropia yezoensis]|uniref:Uncharacterized protein n=1 Tax=Pyropia yezoensis TaxID=2788 RepID=A0ACC3CB15_PYRYE|nr:hypothetical protein I4F81_009869 [Neopyropia yezoensis]